MAQPLRTATVISAITVADAMTRRPVVLPPDATIEAAIDLMHDRGLSSILVPPPPGSADYGIVTMRDVVTRVLGAHLDPAQIEVRTLAAWRPLTALPHWSVQQAAQRMAQTGVRRLAVIENGDIVAVISDTDVLTSLVPQTAWAHARLVRKARAYRRAFRLSAAGAVGDLMSYPVLTLPPGATVRRAVDTMVTAGISSLVVDGGGIPRGMITKRDVIAAVVAPGRDPGVVPVAAIMSSPVRTVGKGASLRECFALMARAGVRHLPVVAGGEIAGIISESDLFAAIAAGRAWAYRRRPTAVIAADLIDSAAADGARTWNEAVTPEASIWTCAERLARSGARELAVVQEGRVIGVVCDTAIVRALEERGGPD